ncbi:MAG: DUF1080 domain-containing protein [Fibrobacterota bacterium]|nr:DUF1080 domain-containing protein [Fibrobacterota bacterium]
MPKRINHPLNLLSVIAMTAFATLNVSAQNVNLKGRVLDKVNMEPVAGASVKVSSSGLAAVTGADGRFVLKGDVTGLRHGSLYKPGSPYFRDGNLHFDALAASQPVRVEFLDASGQTADVKDFHAANAGWNRVGISTWPEENFFGFARITTGGDAYLQRVLRFAGPTGSGGARTQSAIPVSARRGVGKTAAGKIDVSMDRLLPKSVPYAADSADLGDIVLDYPARAKIGVGAAMPYGAYVHFDGSNGKAAAQAELKSKWQDWMPVVEGTETAKFIAARDQFKIAKDPQFPNDTNRVTLQSCCSKTWGYDDIHAIKTHGDAQIHVEFNPMGEYDNTENPNPFGTPGSYFNSGVYVQNRYEVQVVSWILDSTKIGGNHDMGSLVDDWAPTKNPNKDNGQWQSYDITFRSARYDAQGNRTDYGRITVWWNGVMVHDNRIVYGKGSGLKNHSGEELTPTLHGLKLQSEGTDVRYRNIWIKDLNIKDTQTNFGY